MKCEKIVESELSYIRNPQSAETHIIKDNPNEISAREVDSDSLSLDSNGSSSEQEEASPCCPSSETGKL